MHILKTNQRWAHKYTNCSRDHFPTLLHHVVFVFFLQTNKRLLVLVTEQFFRKCIIADTVRISALWGFKVPFIFFYDGLWGRSLPPQWGPVSRKLVSIANLWDGGLGGARLHIDRVFPRHQANFNLFLLHSHYRHLGWHKQGRVSLWSLPKRQEHACVSTPASHKHTHTRTETRGHLAALSGHWRTVEESTCSTTHTHTLTYRSH